MFLRLRLVDEQLEPGMLDKDVQDVLNSVPDGLERAYQRNIEAILKTTTKNCQRALDILQILLFATRPLSVMELLCALRMKDVVDQGSKERPGFIQDYEINNLNIQTLIVKPCCSLIEVRGGSGSDPVHFVHFSVKEYLLERMRSEALYRSNPSGRNHDTPYIFGPRNGDDILHEVCLSYVFMRANFEKFGDSSFHEYARSNWAVHFNRLTGDSRSQGLRLQKSLFLGPWFKKWEDKQKRQWDVPNALKDIVDGVTLSPAEMAAMLSLPDLSISLFPDGKTPQRVLAYAAGFGDAATVRTLLQRRKDLDVNWAADGYPWMPLSTACRGGSDSALEALLENEGLNLFGPLNDEGDTALHYTIRQCRNRISDLLLKRGFDVNCKNKGGERPLHIVCSRMLRQWLEPLELLLREDVDLNARDNWGRSVIHKLCSGFIAQLDGFLARDWRFMAPRKLLLHVPMKALKLLFLHKRNNVNMNAVDIQGRTPLDYMYLMSSAPNDIRSLYLSTMQKVLIDHGAIRADQLQIMGMIETASISPAGHDSGPPEDCMTVTTVCATISVNSGETSLTPTDEGTRPIDQHLEATDAGACESDVGVKGAQTALETDDGKFQNTKDARDSAQITPDYSSDVGEPKTWQSLTGNPHRTDTSATAIAEGEVGESSPAISNTQMVLPVPHFLYFILPFVMFIVSLYLNL